MHIAAIDSYVSGSGHFIRVSTDTGITGVGQSACWGYPLAVDAIIQTFRSYLVGQDPMRIEHHWQYLYRMAPFRGSVLGGAVSAVDIALWDIKGQHLQAPIWELLGGKCRDKVRLHLLMGGGTAEEIAAQTRNAIQQGFTAVKFDPIPDHFADMTLHQLIGEVVARVAAARETAGSAADLILELHRKLTPLQALPVAAAVAPFHPLFLEDPIQIDSIQSQAEIARRITSALANGERLHTIWEFKDLLLQGGSQYVRPDLGLAGGLTHCKKIAAIAESFHAAVVTHNFLGPILTAASVHLDVAIPNFLTQEYALIDEGTFATAFPGALQRTGGYLAAPEAPGLGVLLDVTMLAGVERFLWDPRHIALRADGSVVAAV